MASLPQFCLPNFDAKVGNDLRHDFFNSAEVTTLPLGYIVLYHEGQCLHIFFKSVFGASEMDLADDGASLSLITHL